MNIDSEMFFLFFMAFAFVGMIITRYIDSKVKQKKSQDKKEILIELFKTEGFKYMSTEEKTKMLKEYI